MSFASVLDITALNGINGFTINAIASENFLFGASVSNAGDVNGDGIDDIIVGARGADPGGRTDAGESYVIFGSTNGFDNAVNLADLNGSNGFALAGISSSDGSGVSVSAAGDINGDGFGDVIVGALAALIPNTNQRDAGYIIFGHSTFGSRLELASLNGSSGVVLEGTGDELGVSVSNVGDINNDGLDDVIIGGPASDLSGLGDNGQAIVLFGNNSGFDSNVNLGMLNGSNGFSIIGLNDNDELGFSTSGVGDINGDGIDDFIVGAPQRVTEGKSYVIFGKSNGFFGSFNLATLDGTNGFLIEGVSDRDFTSGVSVSGAGDINGDGLNDLIIGVPAIDKSYVVFGQNGGFSNTINLANLNGSNGFTLIGKSGDFTGVSVSQAGDVNGDGLDDIIIGASVAEPVGRGPGDNFGAAYIVFGNSNGFNSLFNLEDLNGVNGVRVDGFRLARLGESVSGAGDINADGFDDVIISSREGSHVIFGQSSLPEFGDGMLGEKPPRIRFGQGKKGRLIRGDKGKNKIQGTTGNDRLFGKNGNDTLNGKKGKDRIDGGKGNDKIKGGTGNDELKGGKGNGRDRLNGQGGDDVLVGGQGKDVLIGGAGRDLFVYESINDGKDIIRGFHTSQNLIDLSKIFDDSAYMTGEPDIKRFSDFVELVEIQGNTEVRIDIDGSGLGMATASLALVQRVTGLTSDNFIIK